MRYTYCLRYNGQNEVLTSALSEADAIDAARARWRECDSLVVVYTIQFHKSRPTLARGEEWHQTTRGGYVEKEICRI